MKKVVRHLRYSLFGILCAGMVIAVASSCDTQATIDEFVGVQKSAAFDPSKPVTISDFSPHSGAQGQKLILFGNNFGNDTSIVKVSIGGRPAPLINVKNDELYCFVPNKAFSGEIQVTVGDSLHSQTAIADSLFNYQRKMVVGSLCGYRNERDDQGWHDGPFETCTGFRKDCCMNFDPKFHDRIYVAYDGGPGLQLIDLKNRTVSTVMTNSMFNGINRLRSVDFTADGNDLLITTDGGYGQYRWPVVWLVSRNADGSFTNNSPVNLIASYRDCNFAVAHPVNGEIYFNSYDKGEMLRLDLDAYKRTVNEGGTWKPALPDHQGVDEDIRVLWTIQDNNWEFKMFIHPTGNYAYIVCVNQNYILRTDYNAATKTFAPPYIVGGLMRNPGYVDGVGTAARINRPYQGVFVKNPDYVKEGRTDQYDFYFCETENHCIRKLTPDGMFVTYAGRGEEGHAQDGSYYGNEDGDLRSVARFRNPHAITYDEKTNTFYIVDVGNRKIRTISVEQ